jgi:hypothetical protein
MEVHHHPKVGKKNFKEYFLEFIMIFLAVSLGFFAESLREHKSDRSKEKEYISSLRQDLISDTSNINSYLSGFNSRIQQFDTLISITTTSGECSKWFVYVLPRTTCNSRDSLR